MAPEVWLRGPLPGVPALLQPVAHALLQAREEVEVVMEGFPPEKLWTRPGGVVPVGFHLQHLAGVLDRLFTYARGESLGEPELAALRAEEQKDGPPLPVLLQRYREQVDRALAELRGVDESTLTQARSVGRLKLPTTALGLYVHAAEHTMRHVGQLLVTARVQRS